MNHFGKKSNPRNSEKGFTLVIVAIVLMIAGYALTTMLKPEPVVLLPKVQKTRRILFELDNAIQLYKQIHGSYPCPASRSLLPNDADFGVSATCKSGSNECQTSDGVACATTNVSVGTVPTRSLQLPDHLMFDEWGNRIAYAMDVNGSKGIELQNIDGTNIRNSRYFLFSHGPNSRGAYNRSGTIVKACGALTSPPYDPQNCNDSDVTFFADTWRANANQTSRDYDDIVQEPIPDPPPCPANVEGCTMWLAADDTDGDLLCTSYDVDIDGVGCTAADTDEPSNSSTISSWVDKTGNGRSVTFSSLPTFYTAQIGTKPSIRVGRAAYGVTPSASWGNKYTIFAVTKTLGWYVAETNIARFNDSNYFTFYNPDYYKNGTRRWTARSANYYGQTGSIRTDAPDIATFQYDGTSNEFRYFQNGVNVVNFSPTAGALASTSSQPLVFGESSGHPNYGYAYLSELIVYPSSIDDDDRKEVECYLSKKYALGNPDCEEQCPAVNLCPAGVAGCDTWLDASDTDTVLDAAGEPVTDGNVITTWCDKSPNQRHAAAVGSVTLSSNGMGTGLPGLTFDSAAVVTPTNDAVDTEYTATIVIRPTGNLNTTGIQYYNTNFLWNRGRYFGSGNTGTTGAALQAFMWSYPKYFGLCNATAWSAYCSSSNLYTNAISNSALTNQFYYNTNYIVTVVKPQSSGNTSIYINGNLFAVKAISSESYDLSELLGPFVGKIAEYTKYPTALSDPDREAVEAEMAAKWNIGFAGASCPAVTPACPGGVPGCYMWLDATETSTMRKVDGSAASVDNDQISNWCDKSGNGNNAWVNGTAYYKANSFGSGLHGVANYTGSTYMGSIYASLADTDSERTYVMVYKPYGTAWPHSDGYLSIFTNNYYQFQWSRGMEFTSVPGATAGQAMTPVGHPASYAALNILSLVTDGTNLKVYHNGVKTGETTMTALTEPFWNEWILPTLKATLGEVVAFDSALSDTDREAVESELAAKWGTKIPTDFTCPASSSCPAGISGCELWFDASDASTMLKSDGAAVSSDGDSIAYLCDKSGTDHHGLATKTYNSTFDKDYFAAGLHAITTPAFMTPVSDLRSDISGYAVFKSTAAWNIGFGLFSTPFNSTSDGHPNYGSYFGFIYNWCPWNECRLGYMWSRVPGVSTNCTTTRSGYCGQATTSTYTSTNTHIVLFRWDEAVGTIWHNGVVAGGPGGTMLDNSKASLASLLVGGGASQKLGEFMIYPQALSDAEAKELTCYLHNKWNECTQLGTASPNYCDGVGSGLDYDTYCDGTTANP